MSREIVNDVQCFCCTYWQLTENNARECEQEKEEEDGEHFTEK